MIWVNTPWQHFLVTLFLKETGIDVEPLQSGLIADERSDLAERFDESG